MTDHLWPYSSQYAEIVGEGHERPPPTLGAPTLVWHLGIWQGQQLPSPEPRQSPFSDRRPLSLATRVRDILRSRRLADRVSDQTHEQRREAVIRDIEKRNQEFYIVIASFLNKLRERGCVLEKSAQEHRHRALEFRAGGGEPYQFGKCEPPSVAFTIWWQDKARDGRPNEPQAEPDPTDLRVRVVAQTNLEHATVSFFVDVGKSWNSPPVFALGDSVGLRRRAIFQFIEHIRRICSEQIRDGSLDFDVVPERLRSPEDARILLDAADYFYDGIWREFLKSFGFDLPEGSSSPALGELFADIRGLVHSVEGIPTPANRQHHQRTEELRKSLELAPQARTGSSSTVGIGRFETFDKKGGEPNTMLKAYWPFIRRMAPRADQRDFLGCGILDWRCLFVSPLGSPIEPPTRDESTDPASDVPHASLPHAPAGMIWPIRFLLMTKGEPHRQQIGRSVERINALTSMRLFALKHWSEISNAGTHLRVLDRELDDVLTGWSKKRRAIEEAYERHLGQLGLRPDSEVRKRYTPRRVQDARDNRLRGLNRLIANTEGRLIFLSAALDKIGRKGSGRLLYAVNRSRFAIAEFKRMEPTLEVGNVDGWVNHTQFVARGVRPVFDSIENVGRTLNELRDRLQMITEMIQTSALIVEAEATSSNTELLRKIGSDRAATGYGIWGLVILTLTGWLIEGSTFPGIVRGFFGRLLSALLQWLQVT